MFELKQSPSYWWPVTVRQPAGGDQAGTVAAIDLEVEFVRLNEDSFEALLTEVSTQRPKDRDIARRVIRAFRHLPAGGAKVAYSGQDHIAQLLNVPGAGSAIVAAFFDSRVPAAEKN